MELREDGLNAAWAENANTTLTPPPVEGEAYRDVTITPAFYSTGLTYRNVYEGRATNAALYNISGVARHCELYAGIPYSPKTQYFPKSRCLYNNREYFCLLENGEGLPAGPQPPTGTDEGNGYWTPLYITATRAQDAPRAGGACPGDMLWRMATAYEIPASGNIGKITYTGYQSIKTESNEFFTGTIAPCLVHSGSAIGVKTITIPTPGLYVTFITGVATGPAEDAMNMLPCGPFFSADPGAVTVQYNALQFAYGNMYMSFSFMAIKDPRIARRSFSGAALTAPDLDTPRQETIPADWATSASTDVTAPEIGKSYRAGTVEELQNGFAYNAPLNSALYNQGLYEVTPSLRQAEYYGGIPYSTLINYQVNARSLNVAGYEYRCIAENGPATPAGLQAPPAEGDSAYWRRIRTTAPPLPPPLPGFDVFINTGLTNFIQTVRGRFWTWGEVTLTLAGIPDLKGAVTFAKNVGTTDYAVTMINATQGASVGTGLPYVHSKTATGFSIYRAQQSAHTTETWLWCARNM